MKKIYLSIVFLSSITAASHADFYVFVQADFRFEAGENTSFNILTQSTNASAVASINPAQPPTCAKDCVQDVDLELDTDFLAGGGATTSEANAHAGNQTCGPGTNVRSISSLSTSSSIISWAGTISGFGNDNQKCPISNSNGGGGIGAEVDFEILGAGTVTISPPNPCFTGSNNANASTERYVFATIICLNGPSGTSIISNSTTQIGLNFINRCPVSSETVPGTYNLNSISIIIGDTTHDVTGDERFNIEDSSFLQNLVGTSSAFSPLYVDRFDYNQDGEVDQGDVNMVHKFVDAGLSSGLFGDTNRDGVVDCCDLDGYDAAFGSFFNTPNTAYLVELDWDLDGDIDAIDQAQFDSTACIADINNDHTVNFLDTSIFLSLFNAGDLSVDFNGDGALNFFDVNLFLAASGKTCS